MNTIVREHFPAANLPPELRAGIDPGAAVTVTIIVENQTDLEPVLTLEQMFSMRHRSFHSIAEVNAHVRAMRDEWND